LKRAVLAFAACSLVSPVAAQERLTDDWRNTVRISQGELASAIGLTAYKVDCPLYNPHPQDSRYAYQIALQRSVRVEIAKPGLEYRQPVYLAALLDEAARRTWAQCPALDGFSPTREFLQIKSAEIYARPEPSAELQLVARAGRYDHYRQQWGHVVDVYADRQEREAGEGERQARVDAEEAAQQAAAPVAEPPSQQVEIQHNDYVPPTPTPERRSKGGGGFVVFWLLVGLGFLLFKWQTVLRWYYLLTPHPAGRHVDEALLGGGQLDADAFAAALRDNVGTNEFERAARAQQVEQMTARWRSHEQALAAQ
jgi:hypothetical protein